MNKKTIVLETLYTPYTLDTYNTFTFEGVEESEIDYYNQEHETELNYDDFSWEYKTEEYLEALAVNLVNLLNENIVDEVILRVELDGVHSPLTMNINQTIKTLDEAEQFAIAFILTAKPHRKTS